MLLETKKPQINEIQGKNHPIKMIALCTERTPSLITKVRRFDAYLRRAREILSCVPVAQLALTRWLTKFPSKII